MKKYNVAVVGVGAVGVELLRCLKQRNFPVADLRVFARSAREIEVDKDKYQVEALEGSDPQGIEIALFAGTEGEKGASRMYSKKFIEAGAVVIDNGADFRLEENVPLVVPEANREAIFDHQGLIANPNCTTIQMIAALAGVYKQFGLSRILLTSFQATSGGGKKAAMTLWEETTEVVEQNKDRSFDGLKKKLKKEFSVFSGQIAFNVIPQIGGFTEEDYTSEEWKVVNETHKIFSDENIKISATCARVPVFTSHSEAVYFETEKDADLDEIKKAIRDTEGVVLSSDYKYPFPLDTEGKEPVFVSRVRRDPSVKNSFWLWVVADNLKKGAALNAVQIAEELIKGK